MALDKTKFSDRVWYNIDKNAVLIPNTNRNYDGDAATSAVVKVSKASPVTVGTYLGQPYTGSVSSMDFSQVDLNIDQKKEFRFQASQRDVQQWSPLTIEQYAVNAAKQLIATADQYISSKVSASVYAEGKLTSFIATGSTAPQLVHNAINDVALVVTKNGGKADAKIFIDYTLYNKLFAWQDGNYYLARPEIMDNGLVQGQRFHGAQLYISDNLSGNYILGFSQNAVTFAPGLNPEAIQEKTVIGINGTVYEGYFDYGTLVIDASGSAIKPYTLA